ncbi:MAG TPA: hypothetical protein VFU86_12100, partial [Terriglobales bacterium]|nr:hypothetical protein [Terriglobales bacterium]
MPSAGREKISCDTGSWSTRGRSARELELVTRYPMSRAPQPSDHLRKIVEAFPRLTITVLGDMVADEFVFGDISRVSREAPVLILRHRERTVVPGGGANA